MTARLYSSDEVHYFSYLRSLWFDRDVSFENEYQYFYDHNIAQSAGYHETFLERRTETGRRFNYGTIGCAILWSPFYAVADVWTRISGSAPADGFSKPYVRAVAYGSAFYGFLAILLSIRAARIVVVSPKGLTHVVAGLAMWIGTPLLFYMYVAPPFSHACSAFAVALFVSIWLHVRQTWTPAGTFALGLSAALMGMVREQDAFLALGPAVDFALAVSTSNAELLTSKGLKAAGLGLFGVLLGSVPQLLAYISLNGRPGPASHVSRKMYWHSPHGLQVLLSPEHGFFFWTPLAIVAIAGLVVLTRVAAVRRIAICLLVMVVSQVYVAGSVDSWSVAGAFGQRRFVCLTIVLAIGLAAFLNAMRSAAPKIALAGIVILAWWNVALMAQFATGMMNRQKLEPGRNAYNAFVTLPLQTPSLVYRYLKDRESFYHPHPAAQGGK